MRGPVHAAGGATPSQVAWLKQALVPLSSTSPTDDLSDLEPLRAIIGDARIVALGEATHGTREFFTMKHRILRFLAREMGFTGFAIEATWPESNRVDRYVRTGVGSVDTLLSGLYFWTWNYGQSYVRIGFAFGTGGFNAVPFSHALGGVSTGQVRAHAVQTIAPLSYEHYFSSAGVPHFLLDLQDRQADGDSAQWLAGPRLHRSVGATWDPTADHFYWVQRAFPDDFDVMIYIHQTLPSTLLPFQYPTEF